MKDHKDISKFEKNTEEVLKFSGLLILVVGAMLTYRKIWMRSHSFDD
jgi:hypothetical protein